MKTVSTFWSQLEADIDKYSNRAKKNLKQYENRQFKQAKGIKNKPKSVSYLTSPR